MAIQQTLQLCIVLAIVAIGIKSSLTLAELDVGSYDSIPFDDYFVARGHTARLECDVALGWQESSSLLSQPSQAYPMAVEARWLLNGVPLTKDDGRWKVYKNGTLVIPKFGKRLNNNGSGNVMLEGFYQCLTANQRIGALLARTINLRIAYMKEFVRQPEDLHVREGQPVIIPCSINSLPKATVEWERDDEPLPQYKKYVPLPSGSLLITNVHSSDVGSYRCKVVNIILKKTKKSKAGFLAVHPSVDVNDDSEDTRILPLDIESNVTAHVGSDVTLYCVVTGRPKPIRWLHDHDNVVLSNNSVLTLRNITLRERGRYTCTVLGPEGLLTKEYMVSVNQAPVFNNTPSSGVHTLARNIRLNCTATGTPPPQIRWFKNGRPFNVRMHIRARVYDLGLLISSSTASDGGFYQCLATNAAGSVWSRALVRLNLTNNSPSEPRDIQCLPYKQDSVCLRWRGQPNVTAYTIITHMTGSELSSDAKPLKEHPTNETYKLLDNLYTNANYTFLIRTFSTKASPEFAIVTCITGIRGVRNFTAQLDGPNSMVLNWQPVSSDYNPCNEAKNQNYRVQWRKTHSDGFNSFDVVGFETTISGLISGENYEFRVKPTSASEASYDNLLYAMPAIRDLQQEQGGGNNLDSLIFNETDTDLIVIPPLQLEAVAISTSSINVSWTDRNPKDTLYTVCYIVHDERKTCEIQGKLVENFIGKSLLIERLRPKTEYEIRVQANYHDQYTKFSHSLLIATPSDVPSEVQGLEYMILTRTSACIKWEPPSHANGRITKYSVRHTSNLSWALDKWLASSIFMPRSNDGCWNYDSEGLMVSTVLHDLDPELVYHVNVMAVNDAGSGSPTIPITISTKYPFIVDADDGSGSNDEDDKYYRQSIGVALGFGIAVILIFACACSFFVHKYVKKRLMAQRHFVPNGGPYSSTTTRPKQTNGNQCRNDTHELQHLVETNGHSHIPNLPADTLDTKGGTEYPNGVNNTNHNKTGYLNGHATNLRITENPQYYKKADIKSIDEVSALNPEREYEEDSNSNLQKVCPNTKSLCINRDVLTTPNDGNTTFDSTQTTILLDDSVSSTSSPRQPTLEPNG